MKKCKYWFSFFVLIIFISLIISGCGGGSKTIEDNHHSDTLDNTSILASPTPSSGVPGTFTVKVYFSRIKTKSFEDPIPYTLKVTITGDAISMPMVGTVDISSGGLYTLNINNVPVGLNNAVIQLLNIDNEVLAQRNYPFYMTSGGTTDVGEVSLGVSIDSSGCCNPQSIVIPVGTLLYFENLDQANDRTVKLNSGSISIGPIAKATPASPPNTPANYHTASYRFIIPGIYTYDAGYGAPGEIKVVSYTSLNWIKDSTGDNYDSNNFSSKVDFTLKGINFGPSQSSVNGSVKFIDVDNGQNIYTATITGWSDSYITGNVTIPGGKYLVRVTVGSQNTDYCQVYYYKGAGSYNLTVDVGGWIPQVSGTSEELFGVHFVDSSTGFTVGRNGKILKTENGGITWSTKSSGTTNRLSDIKFSDSTTGWIVGDGGKILKTIDGGNTWNSQNSGTIETLYRGHFFDFNNGWAVGANGTILKTINGGTTWVSKSSISKRLLGVHFINTTTGWVVGDNGTILKTTNGGDSWTIQDSGTSNILCYVNFTDNNNGWIVGQGGTILHTSNGGTSWVAQNSGTSYWLQRVRFIDSNKGLVIGVGGAILYTADGGANWKKQNSTTSSQLNGLHFFDSNKGWAVGQNGTILKYISSFNDSNLKWRKCFGGSSNDYPTSIIQEEDDGFIMAGYTMSNDGDVSGNHGNNDMWVVKFDVHRNIIWQKCLGGTEDDYAYSICKTSDGGYIVAGSTKSNDGDVSGLKGDIDCWVVKLDSSGNIEWQKCLGGSGLDIAKSVQQASDGGYIIAGSTGSNDGDVSGNHGLDDAWVVKLDSSGNIDWQKCFGGSAYDYAKSIGVTSDGGYIFTGSATSNNGDVSGLHGGSDCWVVKLNSSGNIQWQKCLGGSGLDYADSVKQTSDGGYIMAGYVKSNDGDVSGNHGDYDYWVVKLDSFGNMDWQKCLGGNSNDKAHSIQQTIDGGYIVTGSVYSSDGDVTGHIDNYDYWVVKLNSSGVIDWQKSLGGSSSDMSFSVYQTSDGGYVVAGDTFSNDYYVYGNHGGTDCWIIKMDKDGNTL